MHVFGLDEWKDFFLRLYYKVDSTDIFNRAATVAFYFSFSFFPLLLFLVTLAGLVLGSTDSLKRDLYSYMFQVMPVSAYDLVHKTLDEIVENSSGGKLTVSILITLWSASAGADTLRSSLNAIYELNEIRPWWKTRLLSLAITFLFIILLGASLIAVSTGLKAFDFVLNSAGITIDSPFMFVVVQWISLFVVLLFASEVIYNWLPCHKKFRWYWATPGSTVAILLWVMFTGCFRLYLQYFNTYDNTYGSLGAVIILMLWMFFSANAVLIGGSINSVLNEMLPQPNGADEETERSKEVSPNNDN